MMLPQEIERKWLVNEEALVNVMRGDCGAVMSITQGYFEDIRLRCIWGNEYLLTIKRGTGLVRTEIEVHLTEADFNRLWKHVEATLMKVRYVIPVGAYDGQFDLYDGALSGLATVEVEFNSVEEAEAFQAPSWFGEEVTNDERYTNYSLAWNGLP